MKYEFFTENGVQMVRIESEAHNVVVRPATPEDHAAAEAAMPQSSSGVPMPPLDEEPEPEHRAKRKR